MTESRMGPTLDRCNLATMAPGSGPILSVKFGTAPSPPRMDESFGWEGIAICRGLRIGWPGRWWSWGECG